MKPKRGKKKQRGDNVLSGRQLYSPVQYMGTNDGQQVHSAQEDSPQIGAAALPSQVHVAFTAVCSFRAWSRRLRDGFILRQDARFSEEACKDALLCDFDEQISRSIDYAPLWRQPFQCCATLPGPCNELLAPSSQRTILCDVLDTRVSILQRLPDEFKWACIETGKGDAGGCSHFTCETLATDIPESMDIDPVSFAKETVFYSNVPFPASCGQLALKFLPRIREFARAAELTMLHLTFQALRVFIPTVSGVLLRRIPSLGLAAWLDNSSACEPIRTFRHETVQEVLLSGNQYRQADLNETLLSFQVEPALDAYASRLGELFTGAQEQLACGGWLAARMFREALSRNGFDQCLFPPTGSLSLWPILLDSYVKEDQER